MNDGTEAGMWMTLTNKSYDFAFTRDHTGAKDDSTISPMPSTAARRSCGQPTSSLRTASPSNPVRTRCGAADLLPLRVRTRRQPGRSLNAGARLILAPDWKPIVWTEEERKKGQAWGMKTVESFHTYGTPPLEETE